MFITSIRYKGSLIIHFSQIRKHRDELLKFAREIRVRDPTAKVVLQYDRLFVENDVFLYNETEQRVERVLMKMPEGEKILSL